MDYSNLRNQTWYNTAWIYNTPDIQGAAVVKVVVAATVVGSARKMVDGLSQDYKQNLALFQSHVSLTAEWGAKTVLLSILVLMRVKNLYG